MIMYFQTQIYSAFEIGAKVVTENFSFGSPLIFRRKFGSLEKFKILIAKNFLLKF
jgi:hypothetical protein